MRVHVDGYRVLGENEEIEEDVIEILEKVDGCENNRKTYKRVGNLIGCIVAIVVGFVVINMVKNKLT